MFEVIIQDDEVQAMLSRLLQRTGDLSEPMADIARILTNVTEDAFQDETSPFGAPWAPLKSGRQGKILQDTGQLVASIGTASGQDYAELTVGKMIEILGMVTREEKGAESAHVEKRHNRA